MVELRQGKMKGRTAMDNSKRFYELLAFLNMTQNEFAQVTGWPKSSISMYLSGKREMKQDRLGELYTRFDVDPAWMMGYDVPMIRKSNANDTAIPIYGRVAAGHGLTAQQNIEGYIHTDMHIPSDYEMFALKVQGDSMESRIPNGSIVICQKTSAVNDGDIVIALVNGDDAVCKKIKVMKNGIALVSLNPEYEPMIFSKSDIENVPVKIIGKVMEIREQIEH